MDFDGEGVADIGKGVAETIAGRRLAYRREGKQQADATDQNSC
jgi:hypothetical protein